jgi:four helix bundle protein
MADFKKLQVWQKAHQLSIDVDRVASGIRGHAVLRDQMTRAADSIPSNIVEGRAMKGNREFARYLGYSISSSDEIENHLLSARDKGLIPKAVYQALLDQLIEVRRMLHGLLRRLRSDDGGNSG